MFNPHGIDFLRVTKANRLKMSYCFMHLQRRDGIYKLQNMLTFQTNFGSMF
jgi:hypothetical protein